MKAIMVVEDAFSIKKAEVIVSGVNPELDPIDQASIKKIIGGTVKIVTVRGLEFNTLVRDIAISESLIGKKNVSIVLREPADHELRGSIIYAVT